jgi:hypothetical protein
MRREQIERIGGPPDRLVILRHRWTNLNEQRDVVFSSRRNSQNQIAYSQ